MFIFIFERERERDTHGAQVADGQRKGDTESQAGSRLSELSTRGLMRVSNPLNARSLPEPKLDAQ